MSLIEAITNFFASLFKKSSSNGAAGGDSQKKAVLKKLEGEIKLFEPMLCRNGMMLPNFAESIFALYKNVRPLDDLFSLTIGANDLPRQKRFEAQLVMTGYNPEDQDLVSSLSYEARKAEILEDGIDGNKVSRIYESQRKRFDKIVKTLNTDSFKKMDRDIMQLRQLVDFCHTNFTPVLQLFDANFVPGDMNYTPSYVEVPIDRLENALEDLYYQTYGLKITNGTANAVIALANLKSGSEISQEKAQSYLSCIKKIAYILRNIIPAEKLKTLIKYTKGNDSYEPRYATYSGSPRNDFAKMMHDRFETDEHRIKAELQDAKIEMELSSLFQGEALVEVGAYNNEENEELMANSSLSFQWILPMRILKTFLKMYVPDSIKALLNDIVIEGFFANQNYKSNFSSTVYAVMGANETVQAFEDSFGSDQPNSIAVLKSYIKDSHKDHDFYKKLEIMVNNINAEAHKIIQSETSGLYSLYNMMGELLADTKKPSSEIIENLKVLMLSSRNRDNTAFFEQHYPIWKIFFEIMKNYAIISSAEVN